MFSINHIMGIFTYWLLEPTTNDYFNNLIMLIFVLCLTIPYHYRWQTLVITFLSGLLTPPLVILIKYPQYQLAGGSGIICAFIALTVLTTCKQHRYLNTLIIIFITYCVMLSAQPTISIALHAMSIITTSTLITVTHYVIIKTSTKRRKEN